MHAITNLNTANFALKETDSNEEPSADERLIYIVFSLATHPSRIPHSDVPICEEKETH